MRRLFSFSLLLFVAVLGFSTIQNQAAQDLPPAGFQARGRLLKNATLVSSPDREPEQLDLLIVDGLIQQIGADLKPTPGIEVVDLKGFYLYAGFIDADASALLKKEIKYPSADQRKADFKRYALAATRADHRHSLSPAYEITQEIERKGDSFKAHPSAGFTVAQVIPSNRVSGGRTAIVTLREAPLRELVLNSEPGVSFQLFAPGGSTYPGTLMGSTAQLRQAFSDARRHVQHQQIADLQPSQVSRPPEDADWDILAQVAEGELPGYWKAKSRDDVLRVLEFYRQNELADRPIFFGVEEAERVIEELKEAKAGVILSLDFGDRPKVEEEPDPTGFNSELKKPLRVQEDELAQWQQRVLSLQLLSDQQIPVAVSTRDLKKPAEVLSVLRLAIEEGVNERTALAALTTNPAAILDLSARLGTLEAGKEAHIVVTNGPLFEKKTKIHSVYVDGEFRSIDEKATLATNEDGTPATSDAQLAGNWNMLIEAAAGKTVATLKLQQDDAKLTGQFRSDQGDGRVRSGTVTGQKVKFDIVIGAGAQEVVLQFEGELVEESLKGTLKSPFGQASTWLAKKEAEPTEPPADNPVELTLDAPDEPLEAPKEAEKNTDSRPSELRKDRLAIQQMIGGNLLLKNGTIITGTGEVLSGASIEIKEGKITAIGIDLSAAEGTTVIDLGGKFAMPGIIDTHSHIMITGGVNESTQSIVPEVRIRDVVNADDDSEYRALAGGVTSARLLHGSANVIGGQDAVVKLKYGLSAREHILHDAPQGVKFALGENVKARTERFPNTRLGVEATLQRAFLEAVEYRRGWIAFEQQKKASENAELLLPPRRDFRLEALADIVNHEMFIHSHCYRADEILMLLRVASDMGIRVWSLQHVLEGYKIAPEIVAHGASCSTFADWWAYKVEAYDAIPHNAAFLHEAGANSVIKSDDAELIRHLYLEAAKSVRYGNMPEAGAIQAITRNPARELGLDERMGTLEVGKDGDVAIFSGHPLHAFSRCEMTIIEGNIYFDRSKAPTAMSAEAAERNPLPEMWSVPSRDQRPGKLDLEPLRQGKYAIINAHLHPIDADEIPAGMMLVDDGKIKEIGAELEVPEGFSTLDLNGLHVYPGLIDAGTTLGLTEIGRVTETSDYNESGEIQPDLRAGVAINPDSELIPVSRTGGITTILAQPEAGLVAGQASLVRLHGWTTPEMILDLEFGMRINWPGKSEQEKEVKKLKELLAQTRLYQQAKQDAAAAEIEFLVDPRYAAMLPYVTGEKQVLIEAHTRRQIVEAIKFAEEEKLKLILTGATDAWKVAKHLKEKQIPVIVGPVMRKPVEDEDPFDAPYANPGRLFDAGVTFCIRSDHAANSRNAPFEAAMAVAYGLPEAEGLKAVTLSSAKILGLEQELGSLTVGKRATFIITDGSPLLQTTQIYGIAIDGVPFAPESRQTRFYEKYHQRIEPQAAAVEN